MPRFKALIGDLFASRAQTLVNTVNTVGIMGKGVALEFKKRWPAMFDDYKAKCDRQQLQLGEPYLYRDLSGAWIVNFPTKGHWKAATRISDIERGLDQLAARIDEWGITSLAMPPLGCGNGGLEWSEVGPLIYRKMSGLAIDVEVYAPFGTPSLQLGASFLSQPMQTTLLGHGRLAPRFEPASVAVMEVLRGLHDQPYTVPVGRSLFQKLCRVLDMLGAPLGFRPGRAPPATFAEDARAKAILHEFANRNWLIESRSGRKLVPSQQYETDRRKFASEIARQRSAIDRAIDLFSRFADAEQADLAAFVMHAAQQLRHGRADGNLAEDQLQAHVLARRPALRPGDAHDALRTTIRSLAALGFVEVQINDEVDLAA